MPPIVTAKVIAHAFDSKNAIQYFPNDVVELDLGDPDQRKLVWLHTPRGKWVFEFDRANSSSPSNDIYFCKECGKPFDRLSRLGTHHKQVHNTTKNAKALADADNDAEAESAAHRDAALLKLIERQPQAVAEVMPQTEAEVDLVALEQRNRIEAAIRDQRQRSIDEAKAGQA